MAYCCPSSRPKPKLALLGQTVMMVTSFSSAGTTPAMGVADIVAAAIEQNHDERGIIFPASMAPFQVVIIPIGLKKNAEVRAEAEKLYAALSSAGIEVLLDDRDDRPGVMFADMELIGIPHRVVIGERGLKEGNVEYRGRRDEKSEAVPLPEIAGFIKSKLNGG